VPQVTSPVPEPEWEAWSAPGGDAVAADAALGPLDIHVRPAPGFLAYSDCLPPGAEVEAAACAWEPVAVADGAHTAWVGYVRITLLATLDQERDPRPAVADAAIRANAAQEALAAAIAQQSRRLPPSSADEAAPPPPNWQPPWRLLVGIVAGVAAVFFLIVRSNYT
jgi:hypothetical protein